ncbi:MAG: response regulator transcription factor [Candidatus Acidiferrales bacterium]
MRILIADDHDLIRWGVKTLLEFHPGWKICGEAPTGREAVAKVEELKPDVAIVDISMPDLSGIEAARRIRKISPNTEMLVLSAHYSDQLIRECVDAGVRGYVVKSDSDRNLVKAVERLANHQPFFTACASQVILRNSSRTQIQLTEAPQDLRDRLSSREREILRLISEGNSSKEMSSILGISVKTARQYHAQTGNPQRQRPRALCAAQSNHRGLNKKTSEQTGR